MDPQRQYLAEQLQRRESETLKLRRDLGELRTKFFQLERAFEINLRLQTRRDVEFNRVKHENHELRKLSDEVLQAKAELNTELLNVVTEKNHWRSAFFQQKESINRNEVDCNAAVTLVKRECEDILNETRETAEKQFQELIQLYNGAKDKVIKLEKLTGTQQAMLHEYENRSFELANLLETLKRFNVNVDSVCQLVAEVLKNLTDQGNLFEGSMKNLRRLTWTAKDENDKSELSLLRKQNSVLKDVIRNLKRKVHVRTPCENPVREDEQRRKEIPCRIEMNINNNLPNDVPVAEERPPTTVEMPMNSPTRKNHVEFEAKMHETRDAETITVTACENENQRKFDIESTIIDSCGKVLCIESHSNGANYEEYVFKLAIDGEMKIKYPIQLNNNGGPIKMEFVDNENDYELAPLNRMSIFLKNIFASVSVKQTGVSCGTQTVKMKTSNNFVQTTLTGINSISRLNVGGMMLNSEKRAIERSLCNLERTVETLKFNAFDHVRMVVGKDSEFLKMMDCSAATRS